MKERKKFNIKNLPDLLIGGEKIKAKKLYRKLIDIVVIGTILFVIFVLSLIFKGFVEKYLSFAFLTSANFFNLLIIIPGCLLVQRYLNYVDKLRKRRDDEKLNDTQQ